MKQIFTSYLDDLYNRLFKYGILIFDNNGEFIGFKRIANDINDVYRNPKLSEDENDELIKMLHEICYLI